MTNIEANRFAFDSFVTAFAPGNKHLLDQYFSSDLILFNHSVSKQFDLNDLKARLPNLQKIFKDLESEVKELIVEADRMAFRVEQKALFTKNIPDGIPVKIDVMNLYKLENGKVKEWRIWVNQTEI